MSKQESKRNRRNSKQSIATNASADEKEVVLNESEVVPTSDGVVTTEVTVVLSEIESEKARPADINEEEHIEILSKNRAQCMKDGYMLEKPEFDKLHYEDPMVTELKLTEVSIHLIIIITIVFQKYAVVVI